MGKPYDLSPKAKVKSYLGYGFPFDRHDWYVDRAGKEVRYIIDYYFSPEPDADVAGGPVGKGDTLLVPKYTKSIHVDVRPAVDDATSFIDRLRRFPERALAAIAAPRFKAEGLDPAKAPKEAAAFALHSSDNLPKDKPAGAAAAGGAGAAAPPAAAARNPADDVFAIMDSKCKPLLDKFKAATEPETRHNAHIALNYCMATVVCPNEAKSFMDILERKAPEADEEAAFQRMSSCVLSRMTAARDGTAAAAAAAVAPPPPPPAMK